MAKIGDVFCHVKGKFHFVIKSEFSHGKVLLVDVLTETDLLYNTPLTCINTAALLTDNYVLVGRNFKLN